MRTTKRLDLGDAAALLFGAILIATYCIHYSLHRLMWSDELFGWMLCTDPSWKHMLRAWNLGADGGGIAFYTLGRLWLAIFGQHLLAYRMYSAAGIFLGFASVWLVLRQYYPRLLAFGVLTLTWFGSRVMLWQLLQTRFYGLLVGMVGSALWVSLRSTRDEDTLGRQRASTLALVFAINLVLVCTHPFGCAYALLILIAAGLTDALKRQKRPLFYIAALVPWSALVFSRTALENSARVGKPWFWTTRPTFLELRLAYQPDYIMPSLILGIIFTVVALSLLFWAEERRRIVSGLRSRLTVLLPGCLFLLSPIAFWLLSQGKTSYFVDRYYAPSMIGVVILGTEVLTSLYAWKEVQAPLPFLLCCALVTYAIFTDARWCMKPFAANLETPPARDLPGELAAILPRDVPVVLQRADIFDLTIYYRGAPDLPLYSPIDWPLALSPESPRWLVSATHEMENWKFAGYYPDHIVDSEAFLKTHQHFYVVADEIDPWFDQRIARQPGWHLRKVTRFTDPLWASTLWEVTR